MYSQQEKKRQVEQMFCNDSLQNVEVEKKLNKKKTMQL